MKKILLSFILLILSGSSVYAEIERYNAKMPMLVYTGRESPYVLSLSSEGTRLTQAEIEAITKAAIIFNGETMDSDTCAACFDFGTGYKENGQILVDFGTVDFTAGRDRAAELIIFNSSYPNGRVFGTLDIEATDAAAEGATLVSPLSDYYVFQTVAVSGQSNIVAESVTDTLTVAAGSGITLTTNATTDTLTISAPGSMTYPAAGLAKSTGSAWDTSVTDNSANWNSAYSWGNHASAGYVTGTPWTAMGYLTAEVDGSTSNEINTITGDNAGTTSGLAITAAGAGSVTTSVSGNTLTITGTDTNTTYTAGTGMSLVGTTFNCTITQYSDSDISGGESAFTGWDKDASNDFGGAYSSLSGIPSTFAPTSHGNEAHSSAFLTSYSETDPVYAAASANIVFTADTSAWDKTASDDFDGDPDNLSGDTVDDNKVDAGIIADLSGTYQPLDADLTDIADKTGSGPWAFGTVIGVNVTSGSDPGHTHTAYQAADATLSEFAAMPDAGNDPDVDAVGELGRDSNDFSLRGYDGAVQYLYGQKLKTINATIPNPLDLSDAATFPLWFNKTGFTFEIIAIYSRSSSDDVGFTLKEALDTDRTTLTTIEAITISTDGTGVYYNDLTSTIDHTTIESGKGIVFDNDATDAPNWIEIDIVGYYVGDKN